MGKLYNSLYFRGSNTYFNWFSTICNVFGIMIISYLTASTFISVFRRDTLNLYYQKDIAFQKDISIEEIFNSLELQFVLYENINYNVV